MISRRERGAVIMEAHRLKRPNDQKDWLTLSVLYAGGVLVLACGTQKKVGWPSGNL